VRTSAAKDGVVTRFLHDADGLNVLAELDANGTTMARQSYGEGLLSEWRGGAHRWPLYTALGTTTSLTDAAQTVTDTYMLDAYGNPVAQTGQTATPYKYVGRLSYNTDATSGLLLLGARWYDPTVGRFISEDPVRDGGNWFGYADSSPASHIDPDGQLPLGVACIIPCGCYVGTPLAAMAGCWAGGCRQTGTCGACVREVMDEYESQMRTCRIACMACISVQMAIAASEAEAAERARRTRSHPEDWDDLTDYEKTLKDRHKTHPGSDHETGKWETWKKVLTDRQKRSMYEQMEESRRNT